MGLSLFRPTATTTYNFMATSSSGVTATAQATVTVGSSAPTARISANPTFYRVWRQLNANVDLNQRRERDSERRGGCGQWIAICFAHRNDHIYLCGHEFIGCDYARPRLRSQ